MTKKRKPEIWWCIKSYGMLLPWTSSNSRKGCINAYDENIVASVNYARLNRADIYAVKITVAEVLAKETAK